LAKQINAEAAEKLKIPDTNTDYNKEIDRVNDEYSRYLLRTDPEAVAIKDRLQREQRDYTKQRDAALTEIAGMLKSVPAFNPEHLDISVKSYIFVKPVVLRQRGYDNYYWGLGRLGVSMEKITAEIESSRQFLIIGVGIIALIALGLGIAGALIMATITIIPIRTLRAGVAVIRDTTDKALLKDHSIVVKTRDEIRELADTVNQMTQGLVKAAIANKELVVGKEVQKMFIPLDLDASGKKRTTGSAANEFVDIFGYYEGAKGVSGDYFDFKKLDAKHFAIIKCDVAGKGVSAALIMVEVATIFLTFFRDWTVKKDGMKIDTLVYRINDMIEERGFKGRFAALTLCLLNSETGMCVFCNAGDNLVHIYKNKKLKHEILKLNNAPAAGVFPSMLIETQSGFKQISQTLEKGDTLFLFTDGIDEAKRAFRGPDFAPMTCNEPGLKDGESHGGTHMKGSENEELGLGRFEEIIEAVFSRKAFKLIKYHNPLPGEDLTFDFTTCPGTTEDAVTALVAVEKVFRVFPDPHARKDDVVRVDKKIDAFLAKYFVQYKAYFKERFENPEEADYVYFTHLKEDEQYDDLTILAVRKK
jgi:hypothetical protein